MTKQLPRLRQNNGQTIPQIGLGVDGTGNEVAAAAVESALGLGYRSIDTAAFYANEPGVGEGIRRSGVPRDEVHVTTKIWGDSHGSETAVAAFERNLAALGLDHVDHYLIHWPHPQQDRNVETWQTLEKILADGRAKSIGVSDFQPHHLFRLFAETSVRPVVNQIESTPRLPKRATAPVQCRAQRANSGLVTSRSRHSSRKPQARGDRTEAFQKPGPGGPSLARGNRQRSDSEIRYSHQDQGEHRYL